VEASNVKKGMLRVVIDVVLFSLSLSSCIDWFNGDFFSLSLSFLGDDFFPFFFLFLQKKKEEYLSAD